MPSQLFIAGIRAGIGFGRAIEGKGLWSIDNTKLCRLGAEGHTKGEGIAGGGGTADIGCNIRKGADARFD